MDKLERLASLIRQRNTLEAEIALFIGRPALRGHLGEFLESNLFDIALVDSAANKSTDGYFRSGLLEGRSVNIKWYAQDISLLDITPQSLPNTYLVMVGPRAGAGSSRGTAQPLLIDTAYLFDAAALMERLRQNGVKVGIATSVRRELWQAAQIYPAANNSALPLSGEQRRLLANFGSTPKIGV